MSAPLQVIPAVDLMDGRVVRARGGRRSDYQALDCALVADSRPHAVLDALLAFHSFDTLYIADLDAIDGRGDQLALVRELAEHWPGVIWLDAGALTPPGGVRPVFGSEAFVDNETLQAALAMAEQPILSLDRRDRGLIGPAGLEHEPSLWPQDLILMELDRVGSGRGPELERLAALRARAPGYRFHLAGGVHGLADLEAARTAGAAGVLLASVLWDRTLDPDRLTAICMQHAD